MRKLLLAIIMIACTFSAKSQLVVIMNDTATFVGGQPTNQTGCHNSSAMFIARATVPSGTVTYQWQVNPGSGWTNIVNGATYTGASNDTLYIALTTNMDGYTYRCIATTSIGGCTTTSSSATLTVNPLPTPIAGNDTIICEGNSVLLTATGGTGYSWSTGQAINPITVNPTTTTTYTVTVANAFGCTDTDNVVITVNPLPIANAGVNTVICEGNSVLLTATGGTGYSWSTGQNVNSITVSPIVNTTYIATVTNVYSCTATDDVIVRVNPLAVISSQPVAVNICDSNSTAFSITANGVASYQWQSNNGSGWVNITDTIIYTGATTSILGVNAAYNMNSTQYRTVLRTDSGCVKHSNNVTLTVNPLPIAPNVFVGLDILNNSADTAKYCSDYPGVTMSFNTQNSFNYQLQNFDNNTNIGLPITGNGGVRTFNVSNAGRYKILVTNPITGCQKIIK